MKEFNKRLLEILLTDNPQVRTAVVAEGEIYIQFIDGSTLTLD